MGKARGVFSSSYNDVVTSKTIKQSYSQQRQKESGTSSIITPTINNQHKTGETGTITNKVNRSGDILIGSLSHTSLLVEIISGVLTVNATTDSLLYDGTTTDGYTGNRIYALGQGAVNDDLVTIGVPQHRDAMVLYLSMKNGFGNITVKTTGNIVPINGEEFTMSSQNNIYCFMWDIGLQKWLQISTPLAVTQGQQIVIWTGLHSFNGSSFTVNSTTIVLGDSNTDNLFINAKMNTDLVFEANKTVDFFTVSATATSGALTLPANPALFIPVKINGLTYKIPAYNV